MSVNNSDLFSDQYITYDGTRDIDTRKHTLIVEWLHWQIVDFETIGQEANAVACVSILMSDHDHFMSKLQQTL